MTERPLKDEYPAFFETYISQVPEEDILEVLARQGADVAAVFDRVPAGAGHYRYAEGKWSLVQLLNHIVDTERIMAYRALCFARGEQQSLPSFDENIYAAGADVSARTIADLLEELRLVRASNLHLFRHLTDADWRKQGLANNWPITVRSLAWVIAGHLRHHLKIVRERYLPGVG
jgi:hypothetical protein